ncbi:Arc/MetJ-type ribon-helix-helix transcriptional regulator [Desulfofundulus luciae]|uniref:Arc/MetJ-type ribon-helix-helix transcriptional regulator n=1 Tax=Desulfofundulus luciae TaxID=74702 RepID=A0ABU0AZL3_9FIRM|nr:YlcI/YnfO family protein [Desulfofundulus luciae]MDQ0285897.1 Arc/MetJ-type ribon-helix-helix transcriptional regulator [Desulfofundulus luciae]
MTTGNSKITAVRLPLGIVQKIDALVGKGNRSRFIAAAIEKELKRKARLAHIAGAEGFIADDIDTLAFVNRLRAADERRK